MIYRAGLEILDSVRELRHSCYLIKLLIPSFLNSLSFFSLFSLLSLLSFLSFPSLSRSLAHTFSQVGHSE